MTDIKKNFSYNIIYQLLILVLPLITAPYISRVIGTDGIGVYSYTYSIANYFLLFAMLGTNNYGNRSIAKSKKNKEKLDKTFSSIYAFQLIMSVLIIVLYSLYVFFLEKKEYKLYAWIQLLLIASSIFDINWLFFGLEKFKLTIIRNVIIKLISVALIFILVKTKEDLELYILILAASALISQISLWPFLKKNVKLQKVKGQDIKVHIKPNLILFIPVIAISIYNIMDKIMLGRLTNATELGLYENSEKIINVPISIISALGTVMMPRISNLLVSDDEEVAKSYIDKSMTFIIFITIPITLGIMSISEDFIPIFYGEEFIKAGYLTKILSITILFKAWANVIRTQYLLPKEKDKFYVISVLLGALVNFVFNLALIPRLDGLGAIIGTIMAEFIVALYQTYSVRKELNIKSYLISSVPFIITGGIMYIIINLLKGFIENKYILIFTQILVGGSIYLTLNYKYILDNINIVLNTKRIREKV